MILFGWSTRSSVAATATFDCPVCQSQQPCEMVQSRRWFTLYFLPILPLGPVGEQRVCSRCGSRFNPDRLEPAIAQFASGGGRAWAAASTGPRGFDGPAGIVPAKYASPAAGFASGSTFQPPGGRVPSALSSLSIVSLILGILSPILLFGCFTSLLSAPAAIACGHFALRNIKRSAGRLHGKWQAVVGLVLGYSTLLLTLLAIAWIFNSVRHADPAAASVAANDSADRLRDAEYMVLADRGAGSAFGNTAQAKQMASEFSQQLLEADEMLFTKGRERIVQLSRGQFLTFCELHEDSCAFVVHVPSYRDYSDEAEEVLTELAWELAHTLASEHLAPGDSLAVGLRGTLLYGAVATGRISKNPEEETSPFRLGERDDLLAFFPAPQPLEGAQSPEATAELASDGTVAGAPATEPQPSNKPAPAVEPSGSAGSLPKAVRSASAFENQLKIEPVHSIAGGQWPIRALAFSPDSRWLVIGKVDQTVNVVDTASGKTVTADHNFPDMMRIDQLCFTHQEGQLIVGGASGDVSISPVSDSGTLGETRHLHRQERRITCLVASPAQPLVLSGGNDGELVWQPTADGAEPRVLEALGDTVLAAHLPENGSDALATDGRELIRFSLESGEEIERHALQNRPVRVAAFSPDGSMVATGHGFHSELWDARTGRSLRKLRSDDNEMHWSLIFDPQGRWLISGGGGRASVWDVQTGDRLAVLELGGAQTVATMAVSGDGLLALGFSGGSSECQVFQLPQ